MTKAKQVIDKDIEIDNSINDMLQDLSHTPRLRKKFLEVIDLINKD